MSRRLALPPWHIAWCIVVTIALVLRLAGLDRKSVWFDEAFGVRAAHLPIPQLLDTVGGETHPPLYFLLQHFWLLLQTGDWWLRLPAALAGTAAVGVTAVFARDVLGRTAGSIAGLLVAVSPMSVDLSQEARPYGLLFLFASTSLLCLTRALQGSSRLWWIGFIAATELALYTHNYATLLVAAEAAFLAVRQAAARRWDAWALGSLVTVGALFTPWIAHAIAQIQFVQQGFWIEQPTSSVGWDTYQAFLVYAPFDHGGGTAVLLKIVRWLVLGLLALALLRVRRKAPMLLCAVALFVPIVLAVTISVFVVPIYGVRYVSFAAGSFWTLVVGGLQRVPFRVVQVTLLAVIVIGVVSNLPALYLDPYYSRADLRSAVSYIRSNWEPGDLVINTREFSSLPLAYYNPGGLQEEVLLPNLDTRALHEAAVGHQRLWLVRDFGLTDPAEDAATAQESLNYLDGLVVLRRVEFLGVHLFLARVSSA